MSELMALIDEKGKLLTINPKNTIENSMLVSLIGYYEVLNEQRYSEAKWDFDIKCWVGVGEQRQIEIQPISEIQKLWDMIDYLVNSSYEV